MFKQLRSSCDFDARAAAVQAFNAQHTHRKVSCACSCLDGRCSCSQPAARHLPAAHHVRHVVHGQVHEPGRGAGAPAAGRVGAGASRRHRDGAGLAHQDGADRGARAGRHPGMCFRNLPCPPFPPWPRSQDAVHLVETATDKVTNTSPTAASVQSDINGGAVLHACEQLVSFGRWCVCTASNASSRRRVWLRCARNFPATRSQTL